MFYSFTDSIYLVIYSYEQGLNEGDKSDLIYAVARLSIGFSKEHTCKTMIETFPRVKNNFLLSITTNDSVSKCTESADLQRPPVAVIQALVFAARWLDSPH